MRIFDADGNERDWEWIKDKYNLPEIDRALKELDHWEVVELRERIGPVAMRICIAGERRIGISLRIDWPSGHVIQKTNMEGYTDFVLNAYYRPPKTGPYSVYINLAVSDIVDGLGMIGKTNHAHLEPTFQFVKGEEPPEDGWKEKYERDHQALLEIHAITTEAIVYSVVRN